MVNEDGYGYVYFLLTLVFLLHRHRLVKIEDSVSGLETTEMVRNKPFALGSAIESAHKRIVWGLHFCPFDPSLLASGSRDGCVKLWKASIPQQESDTNPTLTEVSL